MTFTEQQRVLLDRLSAAFLACRRGGMRFIASEGDLIPYLASQEPATPQKLGIVAENARNADQLLDVADTIYWLD